MSHCVRVLGIPLIAVYQTSRQFDWLNSSIRKQNDCCKQHLYCPNLNTNRIACAKQTIVDIICIVRNWKQIKLRDQNITNLYCLFVLSSTDRSKILAFFLWKSPIQRMLWQELYKFIATKHLFVCLLFSYPLESFFFITMGFLRWQGNCSALK